MKLNILGGKLIYNISISVFMTSITNFLVCVCVPGGTRERALSAGTRRSASGGLCSSSHLPQSHTSCSETRSAGKQNKFSWESTGSSCM